MFLWILLWFHLSETKLGSTKTIDADAVCPYADCATNRVQPSHQGSRGCQRPNQQGRSAATALRNSTWHTSSLTNSPSGGGSECSYAVRSPKSARARRSQIPPAISSADGSSGPHPTTASIGKSPPRPLELRSGLWRIIRCRQAKTGRSPKRGALIFTETKTAPSSTNALGAV
jgi:hypothetical protein